MSHSITRGTPDPWDPIDVQRRFEERYRQLGTRTPACRADGCPETNPFALTGTAPSISCYQHRSAETGRSMTEAHHVAGQHNRPETVDISGNDHRILSELQRDWPAETLLNPSTSPLTAVAAAIRGWIDVLRLIIDRTLGWIPEALETLNRLLTDLHGPRWWDTIGWQGLPT